MTVKTKYIMALATMLIGGVLYYFWYLGGQTDAYEDIPDLYGSYTITEELAKANTRMKDGKTAIVYSRNPQVKGVAITFDGLPSHKDAEQLVSLVKEYNVPVTVFAEGSTAVMDSETIKTLEDSHITLGNYTYSGLAHVQQESTDVVLEQLIRTQKVLTVLTGREPELMKAPLMDFTPRVLSAVYATGLKGAVKTNVYVPIESIKTDADATRFISTLPEGSVVSFLVSKPVTTVPYTAKKTYEKQVKDKQPGLKNRDSDIKDKEEVTVVAAAGRIFKALKAGNIPIVPVVQLKEFTAQELVNNNSMPVADIVKHDNTINDATNNAGKQISLLERLVPAVYGADVRATTDSSMLVSPAQAASEGLKLPGDKISALPAMMVKENKLSQMTMVESQSSSLEATNSVNNQIPRMIYTTDPAVAFVYAGLTKPDVVRETLNFLKETKSTGTFFVNDSEIRKNPQLVKEIIASGNEVGIAIRPLKNGSYTTVRHQINYVQSKLATMGVSTQLMMQPWGIITEDTLRAIKDEKGIVYRPTVTMVSAKQKDFTSPDAVMAERFGKFSRSLGRGWIVFFRLDYYTDDSLAVKVMNLVKRHKIDNIAYHSFTDDPVVNPYNDSAYAITSMGNILRKTDLLYPYDPNKSYPTDGTAYIMDTNHKESFNHFIANRYIGNVDIKDHNMYGFTIEQKRFRDISGLIHTKEPVVFFTFDDFGNDSAINPILYVLRKHNAKATFFVLTHNIVNNPNIVRAIAVDGNDVASHSEFHHAMSDEPYEAAYSKYLYDYGVANEKLKDVLRGVYHADGTWSYHQYFRPPTLTASRAGFQALYDTGYLYIVSGSYSTQDFEQPDLAHMIQSIKDGLYDKQGNVIKGAVLVMHMNDYAIFTPVALDIILTANDKLPDGDPKKFKTMLLSDFLKDGYSQAKRV